MEYTLTITEEQFFSAAYYGSWALGVFLYVLLGAAFTSLVYFGVDLEKEEVPWLMIFMIWPAILVLFSLIHPFFLAHYLFKNREEKKKCP